jgi:outer membrane protein
VAWEEARQAAIKVGMAQAAYLPILTAGALAGYERLAFPLPTNVVPAGFATSNNMEVAPGASIKYLLFDFGGRSAAVDEAKQLSVSANADFTSAHQKVIYGVARAYFILDGANATVSAAQRGLVDARVLQDSAQALYGRGLGTEVEVDLSRRGTAQAQFDLSRTSTAQKDAMSSLLEAMDLPPTTKLRVASAAGRPLPPRTARTIDDVLQDALRRRPDLRLT